jgi:hypothetical protein
MAYTNDQIFVNAYNAMKHHLASQSGSKLKGLFSEEIVKGEKVFFDRVGTFNVNPITGLGQAISYQDAQVSRRMCSVLPFSNATLISDLEKMKMLVDPTNDFVTEIVNAHNRNFDDVVFNAMLGSAATGKDGSGSQAFDTANQQIAHGGVGMTLAKLLQAQKILRKADVDFDNEDIYLIYGPDAEEDILAITNFTSRDFQSEQGILNGKSLPSFRGMKLVLSNRIPEHTAGNTFRCLAVSSKAMKIAKYAEPELNIDRMANLEDQPYQIYVKSSVGAVRMEEVRIVDILYQ